MQAMHDLQDRKENLGFALAILLALQMLGVAGCDMGRPVNDGDVLSAAFQLRDTLGRPTTTFHVGEEFEITARLTNISGKRLTFYRGSSAPDVLFRILRGDSVVANSFDGHIYLMVVSTGHLDPGETLEGHWRGPTTPPQFPKVVLSPGVYSLVTLFPKFDQVEQTSPPSIQISIIE